MGLICPITWISVRRNRLRQVGTLFGTTNLTCKEVCKLKAHFLLTIQVCEGKNLYPGWKEGRGLLLEDFYQPQRLVYDCYWALGALPKNSEISKEEARFKTERNVTCSRGWTPWQWSRIQPSDNVQRSIVSPTRCMSARWRVPRFSWPCLMSFIEQSSSPSNKLLQFIDNNNPTYLLCARYWTTWIFSLEGSQKSSERSMNNTPFYR